MARVRRATALSLPILLLLAGRSVALEHRCGWLENPTPGNMSLRDRAGGWVLSVQGGYAAEGLDSMPDMTEAGWVELNVHYGYGCACLDVETDPGRKRVRRLLGARSVPLAQCRADRSLPRP